MNFSLDFDSMHGVWVSHMGFKGSYGRIAYRQDENRFWVRWSYDGTTKNRESASCTETKYLKVLPVEPDPWYTSCMYCGKYGLPMLTTSKEML